MTQWSHVDIGKCIACGTCAEKCPKKVADLHNLNLTTRKVIYVEYAQARNLMSGKRADFQVN